MLMRRTHYQGPSGVNATRFPLSKLTLNSEGVAGLVRLLALPNKDVAADAFKNILAAHMKLQKRRLEQTYEQEFNAVGGAAHMLTVLTRQPALVDEFRKRSGQWINWGVVRPFDSAKGRALILIAAQKHHTRVWRFAADWLSADIANCEEAAPASTLKRLTIDLLKRMQSTRASRTDRDITRQAVRMSFSLACCRHASTYQREFLQNKWSPTCAALLMSTLSTSSEIANKAVAAGAIPQLVRLVDVYHVQKEPPIPTVSTELRSALNGLLNCFTKTRQEKRELAARQFSVNGADKLVNMLVTCQAEPLQLQAAAVLQAACTAEWLREQIPPLRLSELSCNPSFNQFTKFLGIRQVKGRSMAVSSDIFTDLPTGTNQHLHMGGSRVEAQPNAGNAIALRPTRRSPYSPTPSFEPERCSDSRQDESLGDGNAGLDSSDTLRRTGDNCMQDSAHSESASDGHHSFSTLNTTAARGSSLKQCADRIDSLELIPSNSHGHVFELAADLKMGFKEPNKARISAVLLLDSIKNDEPPFGSSKDAIPAVLVKCEALPSLKALAHGPLRDCKSVQGLLLLCCIADHATFTVSRENEKLKLVGSLVAAMRAGDRPSYCAQQLIMLCRDYPGIPGYLVRRNLAHECIAASESSSAMYIEQLLHFCRVASAMVDKCFFEDTAY